MCIKLFHVLFRSDRLLTYISVLHAHVTLSQQTDGRRIAFRNKLNVGTHIPNCRRYPGTRQEDDTGGGADRRNLLKNSRVTHSRTRGGRSLDSLLDNIT